MAGTPKIFISYAHLDEPDGATKWLSYVSGFLKPAMKFGAIAFWTDRLIEGGADWNAEIERKIRECDIFVLLVSRNAMASDFIVDKEIAIARERQARGELRVYPILLTPTPKIATDKLADLNLRPPDAKPLSRFPEAERDQIMSDIADEIAAIAKTIVGEARKAATAAPAAFERPCPDFLGRQRDIVKIQTALLTQSPAAVLVQGPGGIGKTEITKAVGSTRKIVARFGERRWFVAMETASDAALMQDAISRMIGADPKGGLAAILAALKAAPGLLVLDNLETPWTPATSRRDVEATLAQLSAVPGLALIASFRGRDRVGGARWALTPEVTRLPPPRDAELFAAVAGKPFDGDACLPKFLAALDGLPLAIDLVARRAHLHDRLAPLWREWERIGADLIDDPDYRDHRAKSLRASLELSLRSPRMSEPAQRLFAFLGASPAGVAAEERDYWLGAEGFLAEETLLKLGLAQMREGRLDLLAPVREFARRARAVSEVDEQAWRRRYLGLAREIGGALGKQAGFGGMARLTPELANLSAALAACVPDRLDEAEAAIWGVGFFLYLGGHPAPVLAELADAFAAIDEKTSEANCYYWVGQAALQRSQHEDARNAYEKALLLYRQAGSVLGEANCIRSLGDIALQRSQHDDARNAYEKARPLYRQVGDIIGEANCIWSLGDIALQRSQHEDARNAYEKALSLFRQVSDVLGEANCIRSLGDIALLRSQHEDARKAYEMARPLYRQVGSVLGEANCIRSLGNIAFNCSEYDDARNAYDKALPLYRQVGDVLGEANCIRGLGQIALERSQFEDARSAYDKALPLYRQVGDVLGEAYCILRLGDIALARSLHEDARRAYEKALPMHRSIGNLHGEGYCLVGLGDVARAHGDPGAAQNYYEQAAPLFERYGDPVEIEVCRKRLASLADKS